MQALANGTPAAGTQPGGPSLIGDYTNYPSYLNVASEAGPRVTVTTAPSVSTVWTFDCFFNCYPQSFGTPHLIYGYRRTTGNVTGVTGTDWSFLFYQNAFATYGWSWGFAFTLNNGTAVSEISTSWGTAGYLFTPNTSQHVGLIVFQSGGSTGYQVWWNGVNVRGATAVASLQNVDFVNSREMILNAGYPAYASSFGAVWRAQMSNIARPATYFQQCASLIL